MSSTHVDALSILGFDPFDEAYRADPYSHFRRIGRLERTSAGLWVTTSYDLCSRVLRDPRFGHRPSGTGTWRQGETQVRSFLTLDPPDHTRLRRLVSKAFTARLIERLRPRIAELVDDLLAKDGPADVIEDLAYPLPVIVISELLGVPPEDHDRFRGWSDALARGLDPDFLLPAAELESREAARQEFRVYFTELADRRRAEPQGDLLSALVAVRDDGDLLDTAELLATCVLLLVAGHETTVNLIGNGALALLRNPAELARFRGGAVEPAIEELLRYDPPVQLTLRTALEDVELDGVRVSRGELVLLLTAAANRDPAVFPDPDRLDLGRPDNRHLAFGLGIHFCLGAPLARMEGQIALRRLFARDVRLEEGPLTYKDNLVLRGLRSLPVTLS